MKEGVLITGSNGFVGKNLLIKIIENGKYDPLKFNRGDSLDFIEQNIIITQTSFHVISIL